MATAVSAARVAALVGSFDRSPAYVGLADTLTLLIGLLHTMLVGGRCVGHD